MEARYDTPRGPLRVFARDGEPPRATVFYVHGYHDTVDSAWKNHRLAEQFAASGRAAVFLVPAAPSSPKEAVEWPDLGALVACVGGFGIAAPRPFVAIGHSGAYRTIVRWLAHRDLKRVILLDGLYSGVPELRGWVAAGSGRLDLVSIARGVPHDNARRLLARAPLGLVTHRVYDVGHMDLITDGAVIPELLREGG